MNNQTDLGMLGLDKIKDVLSYLEKKKRNLDKRKNKLDSLKQNKCDLNEDQKLSLSKYGEIESGIILITETMSHVDSLYKETEKIVKKSQKQEKFERKKHESKLIDFSLRLYNGLWRISNSTPVSMAIIKANAFSENDICILKHFQVTSTQKLSSNPTSSRSSVAGETTVQSNETNNQNHVAGWKHLSDKYLSLFENTEKLCFESHSIVDETKQQLLAGVRRSEVLNLCNRLTEVGWLMSENYLEEAKIICDSRPAGYKDEAETEDEDVEYEDAHDDTAVHNMQRTPVATTATHHGNETSQGQPRFRTQSYNTDLQNQVKPSGEAVVSYGHEAAAIQTYNTENQYPQQATTTRTVSRQSKDEELTEVISPLQNNFNFLHSSCLSQQPVEQSIDQCQQPVAVGSGQYQQQLPHPTTSIPDDRVTNVGMMNNSAAVPAAQPAKINQGQAVVNMQPRSDRIDNWADDDWGNTADDTGAYGSNYKAPAHHQNQEEDIFASATKSEFLHNTRDGPGTFRGNRGSNGPRGAFRGSGRGAGGGSFRGGQWNNQRGSSGYGGQRGGRGAPRGVSGEGGYRGGRGSFNSGNRGRMNGNANVRRQEVPAS